MDKLKKEKEKIKKRKKIKKKMIFKNKNIKFNNDKNNVVKKIKVLGVGGFSKVYLALDSENNHVALKRTKTNKNIKALHMAQNEINILKSISHPHVIKYYNSMILQKKVYLLIEYCCLGNIDKELFDLRRTKTCLLSVLQALQYLHGKNIVHRDITTFNILQQKNEIGEDIVKLSDFGLAVEIKDVCINNKDKYKTSSDVCKSLTASGTIMYVAPEVVSYNVCCADIFSIDIWSFGVLIYYLVIHKYPFKGEYLPQIVDNIKHLKYQIEDASKSHLPKDAVDNALDIIKNIFVLQPKNRFSLEQIKSHPLFL